MYTPPLLRTTVLRNEGLNSAKRGIKRMGRNKKRRESDVRPPIFIVFLNQALTQIRNKFGVWSLKKIGNLFRIPLNTCTTQYLQATTTMANDTMYEDKRTVTANQFGHTAPTY